MNPTVKETAALAMLTLTEAETQEADAAFRVLEGLCAHLPGKAGEPLTALPSPAPLREDCPVPSLDQETLLSQAPARSGDFLLAPRAFGEGGLC